MRNNKSLILLCFLFALGGCSFAPPYTRPVTELPQHWAASPSKGVEAPAQHWWTIYGDAQLNRLVDEALTHNQDLALAT
ncbi:MAG: TolC family protein, partial [Anaerolineae bacterium]|nr:TolC family protein [Anaerolineae bacterium]